MKRVFITGGTGFVGGRVVREFVREGWHVSALVHRASSPEPDALQQLDGVTVLHGDARDYESVSRAVEQAADGPLDAVVHCAGRASDVGRRL